MLKHRKSHHSCGYTLVELLFYIAIFSGVSFAVIDSLITMTKAFRETTIQSELTQGGDIMERISREIRKANDITEISGGNVELDTEDDLGASKTVQFLLTGSDIQFLEDGVLVGNLNSPNIVVTSLTFTQITTANGEAIKIFLTVRSNNDPIGRTVDFYNTVVLRGAY